MDADNAVICVLFATLAASYAWGMRGTVIGGEKGAMLPGAFISLVFAWFSGSAVRENWWFVAATGLMGMTFGGTEPYGETIGMVLHRGRPDYRPIKGYTGLAIKGAFWFSVFGGFVAISLAAMSGSVYSMSDIIVFCLLIPVVQKFGYKIFNCPYDKEKGIFPRIFYSLTRREEWGSNLTLLMTMTAMAVIRNDNFTLAMIAGGFFFGAFGWLLAMKFYVLAVFPLKNGKYIFGKLFHKNLIDGWKIMEFTLGAIGGFGVSLTFCLNFDFVKKYNQIIATSGRWNPIESVETSMPYVIALLAMLIIAVNMYQLVNDKKGKKVNSFLCDQFERPLYNVIPMMLVLLGSEFAARLMTVFMLVFVCLIKCVFDRFDYLKSLPLWQILALLLGIGIFAGDIVIGGYAPFWLIIAGTVPYLVAEPLHAFSKKSRKGRSFAQIIAKTPFATVYPCLVFQSVVIIFASWKIFGI